MAAFFLDGGIFVIDTVTCGLVMHQNNQASIIENRIRSLQNDLKCARKRDRTYDNNQYITSLCYQIERLQRQHIDICDRR
jgi:hypothetical protein